VPQPAEQQRLARRIEPPEVAIRHLATGDPRGRLQHQPLVVGLDAVEHGDRRQQRGTREQRERQALHCRRT
jgi:hypothetical protein